MATAPVMTNHRCSIRRTTLVLVLVLAGALACRDEPGEGPILGVVYGTITRGTDTPVAGATVALWPMDRATCTNRGIAVDSAVTTPTGSFRMEDWSFGGAKGPFSYPVCAQLTVRFPPMLGLRDTTLSAIEYRMYFGPVDSTRIDIQLPE